MFIDAKKGFRGWKVSNLLLNEAMKFFDIWFQQSEGTVTLQDCIDIIHSFMDIKYLQSCRCILLLGLTMTNFGYALNTEVDGLLFRKLMEQGLEISISLLT